MQYLAAQKEPSPFVTRGLNNGDLEVVLFAKTCTRYFEEKKKEKVQ